MKLTAEQDRAVRSWGRGDICVVAGPGSGKTSVLVERLRWLIGDREVAPESVLAITFTEKAANEMRSRLLAGCDAGSERRSLLERAQVSTIDAFCNRLLKENALEAGVDPAFEILDEDESRELLGTAIEQVLDRAYAEDGEAVRTFLASYSRGGAASTRPNSASLQSDLAALVRRIRSYGREPVLSDPAMPVAELCDALRELASAKKGREDLAGIAGRLAEQAEGDAAALQATLRRAAQALKGTRKVGAAKSVVAEIKDNLLPACLAGATSAVHRESLQWLLETVRQILAAFAAAKLPAGRLDFEDVLATAAGLLGSDACPELRYRHILIDEFQDTNPLQVQLVERLLDAHASDRPVRFVVGDINQSIYGFRHADPTVFRRYREGLERRGGEVIRMLDNFRSRAEVLAAVHTVLPGGPGSGVEAHRLAAANRFPDKAGASMDVHVVTEADTEAAEREAAWLAARLRELRNSLRVAARSEEGTGSRALAWGDIAILVRTHRLAARFAASLRRLGLPCQAGGGQRLFAAPETAEIAAFLRVARNPRDEISLAAVLKSPFCGIGDEDLLRLRRCHGNLADAVSETIRGTTGLNSASMGRLRSFWELLEATRADRASTPARILLARAVSSCGYRSYLAGREDGQGALDNLDRLLEWIGRRQVQRSESMDEVSAALDRALDAGGGAAEAPDAVGSGDAIRILTMHAAKGLEFPVVALASLQSRGVGGAPGMRFSPEHGIGARWRDPAGGDPSMDHAYRLVAAETKRSRDEEEDRLLYVAMTRAEDHLILSASFKGAPRRQHWCKPVFGRLGIDPRKEQEGGPEERSAGDCRFTYRRPDGAPEGEGPVGGARAAPEILQPLPPSAQADYGAAVTAVSAFADCPRRYFLSHYLGLSAERRRAKRPTRPADDADMDGDGRREGTDASQFGTDVHLHLAGEMDDPPPAVRRLADRFRNHSLGRRASGADRIRRELAFVFAVGDHLLRGTVDLLFEEGGQSVLVDYKTDRVRAAEMARHVERYAPQIQLYAAGLAKSGRPPAEAYVFYLRRAVAVPIDIGEAALAKARTLALRLFEAQRLQKFPTRPGRRCERCPFAGGACPERAPAPAG